jgi:hypothetical protein
VASSNSLNQSQIETLLLNENEDAEIAGIRPDQSDEGVLQDHNLSGSNELLGQEDIMLNSEAGCDTKSEESELLDADGVSLGSESDTAERLEDIY